MDTVTAGGFVRLDGANVEISQATEKVHALRSNIASVLLGKPQVVEKLSTTGLR